MSHTNERFWRRQARRLARRAAFGFWFARWAPFAAVAVGLGAPIHLLSRRAHREGLVLAGLLTALLAATAAVAWWARRRRLSERDGLVWLEARLGLHNRLSAAAEGVGEWPDADRYAVVFRWRGSKAATPLVFSCALMAAAALVPLSAPEAAAVVAPEAPASWRQTEDWIKSLRQAEVAQPESVEPFADRLDRLRDRPSDDWYSDSTLEASDTLRDQLRSEIRSLATDLDAAAGVLETAASSADGTGADPRRLEAAARGLSSRSLRLRGDLMEKLRDAARQGQQLSPLDAGTVARSLRESAGFCRSTLRECREGDTNCFQLPGKGQGAVQRGPGPAPLVLGDPSATEAERLEAVSNPDMRNASLGDVVETTVGRHQVSVHPHGITTGGAAATGRGGEAVSKAVLTPEERRILSRYFE